MWRVGKEQRVSSPGFAEHAGLVPNLVRSAPAQRKSRLGRPAARGGLLPHENAFRLTRQIMDHKILDKLEALAQNHREYSIQRNHAMN
jgi:hypothetical protein